MFLAGKTSAGVSLRLRDAGVHDAFGDRRRKWECVRGIGHSFGYNREEVPRDFLAFSELVRLLVDIVSKNGNLLLNVGPMPDGTVPGIQREPLEGLGRWLKVNGEAIFGTRPWERSEGRARDGTEVRYTRKGDVLYAITMGSPRGGVEIENLEASRGMKVSMPGIPGELEWKKSDGGIAVNVPDPARDSPALVLRLEPAPRR